MSSKITAFRRNRTPAGNAILRRRCGLLLAISRGAPLQLIEMSSVLIAKNRSNVRVTNGYIPSMARRSCKENTSHFNAAERENSAQSDIPLR
jgi:hypothetical protein